MRRINLMQPYVTPGMRAAAAATLRTRWIGQGPRVDEFEREFSKLMDGAECVATSSCTAALHLAYILAGIKPGDEVVAPLFTCTATNIPLLYCGAKIRFYDVAPGSLNGNRETIAESMTERTKAVVVVHYGGQTVPLPSAAMPLIQDCAQALGGDNERCFGDYACYSFQAVKHVTTGDGGMLVLKRGHVNYGIVGIDEATKVRRMRWFGIDRQAKLEGTWANDITEVGYKYQMTDIAASMGIASLKSLYHQISHRRALRARYIELLRGLLSVQVLDQDPGSACWLCTIRVGDSREDFIKMLASHGIESGQVHYRNDRYSIFRERLTLSEVREFPNMDAMEKHYLVLPMHMGMRLEDVDRVCEAIKGGW